MIQASGIEMFRKAPQREVHVEQSFVPQNSVTKEQLSCIMRTILRES